MTSMHQRHHPVWRPEHDVIARLRVLRGTALISPRFFIVILCPKNLISDDCNLSFKRFRFF